MKGRDIKDKMDFWGRAKNKGNKSADHEGMTRLVSAERAGKKGAGDNSTLSQMTCWRIEKSTQEVSFQFPKPTRAEWLSAGPGQIEGRVGFQTARRFSLSNFLSPSPLLFWQTTWQQQRQTGARALVCTNQTKNQTKPNQSVVGSTPAASVLICRLSEDLICFCLWLMHNYAAAQASMETVWRTKICLLPFKMHPCVFEAADFRAS